MRWMYILFSLITTTSLAATPDIDYTITIPRPQTHYVAVDMRVQDWEEETMTVKMPVWIPGSYLIREFAQHVEAVAAVSPEGEILPVTKKNKNTWVIANEGHEEFTLYYRVYAYEYSVRTSHVTADHAMLNLTSIIMYPEGMLNTSGQLFLVPPPQWQKITTTLPMVDNNPQLRQFTHFDELYDSPIEMGNHTTFDFSVGGVSHTVAMIGPAPYDSAQLKKDIAKIANAGMHIFGEIPCERYIFFVHNTLDNGGGLEHANSTSIIVRRDAYRTEEGYRGILNLIAHEYFHLWNVKRLRPKALGPFNYSRENYTTLLWQVEGFTSYYDEYLLLKAGLITTDYYLRRVTSAMSSIHNTPGNFVQPVAESSLDAWVKYYRQNENSKNAIISYYTKGNVLATCLNLAILHHSEGQNGLDDVMAYMYDRYYKKKNRGFTEEELKEALAKFAGVSFDTFFDQYVHGVVPVDYEQYLGYAGLQLINLRNNETQARLGADLRQSGGRLVVSRVMRNTAAWKGGLNVGDEILAINGERATEAVVQRMEDNAAVGEQWEIIISRDGLVQTLTLSLEVDTRVWYRAVPMAQPTSLQEKIYESWLGTPFPSS